MQNNLTRSLEFDGSGGVARLLRFGALAAVALVVIVANIIMFRQIDIQLERSYTAETDSTTWVVSQTEVELQRYALAITDAIRANGDAQSLEALRLQYDLLYSRVQLVNRHRKLDDLQFRSSPDWQAIGGEQGLVNQALPLIDGPDPALVAALPDMLTEARKVTSGIRNDVVEALMKSIRLVESQRQDLRSSLQVFSAVALGLLGIMAALMITIHLQSRAREQHRRELAQAVYNLRTTIDSSLEAAVILDHDGRVIGCNRAGAEMFGWDENKRVVRYFSDVVRDAKRGSDGIAEIAQACASGDANGQSRITLTGFRPDGASFPLELSVAQARSASGVPIAIAFLRDISERVEREETLRQARNAALQGEEAKSRFLATMSHEMRTPLNGLLSAVELLTGGTKLDAKQSWLVRIIENCGRTTLEQVNNVLDLTRLRGVDDHSFPDTEFALVDLLQGVVAQFEAEARKRGNRIDLNISGLSSPTVRGKRPLILRVLVNLVSNAVKFTEGGQISVSVDCQPGRTANTLAVRISVADTGVGIADADRDRIFSIFETLDGSYARLQEGSGLGLGLSKLAAEAMGGRITVTSRPGEGSTFALFLTLGEVHRSTLEESAEDSAAALRPLNLLVVEDNPVNRELLVEILKMRGHHVHEACDGAEGVAKAAEADYDAILMDVSMPVMDGLEATRNIRASDRNAEVPVIAITANADPSREQHFLESGISAVLSKPVELRRLEVVLAQHVEDPHTPQDVDAPAPTGLAAASEGSHLRLISDGPGKEPAPEEEAKVNKAKAGHDDLPPLLDEDVLADLEDALGADYMSKMASRFLAETETTLLAMRDCEAVGDLPTAAQFAHKNAGAAASLGLKALHRLFVVYEGQAKAGDGDSAALTKEAIERIKLETVDLLKERGLTA